MSLTIINEPTTPCFTKNVITYKVRTNNLFAVHGRLFVETNPYSEQYIFVTEKKAYPDDAGDCYFYLHTLFEEDVLNYDKPKITGAANQVMTQGCKRFKMFFYEYDPTALLLHAEVYNPDFIYYPIPAVTIGTAYVLILEDSQYDINIGFALNSTYYSGTIPLYSLADESWATFTPSYAYDELKVPANTKMSIYEGLPPTLTESNVAYAIMGGTDYMTTKEIES